jgi:leucine dehydrogenase
MVDVNELQKKQEVPLFERLTKMGHEQVVFCSDEETGLKAIIGIHNTKLGPSMGGCRMWPYKNEQEAIVDVLRLSRGMTLKSSIAGLNLGGGKAVIIGDPKSLKDEAFLRRYGRFVDSLGGRYVTAEDVNMSTSDMQYIHMETDYVAGLPENMGGSGDPSPVTAFGTYMGIKAAANYTYGSDSLTGKTVAVQGVGQVGKYLVDHLVKENAKVVITDLSEERIKAVVNKHSVTVVGLDEIYDVEMDIFAPCALGASINDESLKRLNCDIVAGGANNQLEDEQRHGQMLVDKGVTYAPDFVINSGGIINVYLDYMDEYNRDRAYTMAEGIYQTTLNILKLSSSDSISAHEAAIKIALDRVDKVGRVKLSF